MLMLSAPSKGKLMGNHSWQAFKTGNHSWQDLHVDAFCTQQSKGNFKSWKTGKRGGGHGKRSCHQPANTFTQSTPMARATRSEAAYQSCLDPPPPTLNPNVLISQIHEPIPSTKNQTNPVTRIAGRSCMGVLSTSKICLALSPQ